MFAIYLPEHGGMLFRAGGLGTHGTLPSSATLSDPRWLSVHTMPHPWATADPGMHGTPRFGCYSGKYNPQLIKPPADLRGSDQLEYDTNNKTGPDGHHKVMPSGKISGQVAQVPTSATAVTDF